MHFIVHCEAVDGRACWWAEDAAGSNCYTAACDSLVELKLAVWQSCEIEGWPSPEFTLCSCAKEGVVL